MKANELRIGNLVYGIVYNDETDEETHVLCKVLILDSVGETDYPIWVESDSGHEFFDRFEPIPLTEEWLLKFGFEKTKYGFVKMTEIACLRIWEEDVTYSGTLIENIEHVHQLQNLYFALTGEELTLKEI